MDVAVLARMLNADEQGTTIGAPGYAGDFSLARADQEAFDLATLSVADQHLVVAHAGKAFGIAVIAVCLDPEEAAAVERDAIR